MSDFTEKRIDETLKTWNPIYANENRRDVFNLHLRDFPSHFRLALFTTLKMMILSHYF